VAGKPDETFRRVERGMARVENVVRRVVDIEKHGIKAPTGRVGVESRSGDHGEEVALHEPAALIPCERRAERQQLLFMPLDDRRQGFDHDQRRDARIGQGRGGRISEPQTADGDVEFPA
jgi:hypothetical protein